MDFWLKARWDSINARCNNPSCSSYIHYGARGIALHSAFSKAVSFVNYCRTLPGFPATPTAGLSIDRIDNNKGYEPGNLRFANQKTQCRNRRTTFYVNYNGETIDSYTFQEKYCPKYRPHVITKLLKKGMSPEALVERNNSSPYVGRRWKRTTL